MQTTPKANNILGHFFALLGAVVMLAIATWVSASSSEQVKPLDNLATPRTGHTATALSDGRILITGGRDADGNLVAAAEIFDPETQTSSASAALHTARVDHSATVLADGRVLVAGGTGADGALSSAEIFDPAHPENGFVTVGSAMSTARTRHTATLLNDGHVLIAGGDAQGSAELFDPATGTFMPTIWPLTIARSGHTATLFTDDSVLLAGGNTATMETYTPNQGFTLDAATMSVVRTGHWAFELSDTRLLLFQGDTGNTIDEFNPSSGTITPKGSLDFHASSSSLLANGKVLVLGTDVSGLYDPNAVPPAPDFTAFDETSVPHSGVLPRSGQSAVTLPGDKKILISGGVDGDNHLLGQALFNPARIWTDMDNYIPGEPVILSGSGWKPNEDVYLYAVDNINQGWSYGATETAGADGSFVDNPFFIVQLIQQGAQFHVTAVGQSAMQADVYFTDAPRIASVTVGSQTGTLTYGTAGSATFSVQANRGNNGTVNGTYSVISGLPSGATPSFTPATFAANGNNAFPSSTLTVSTTASAPAGVYTITVRCADGADAATTTATLTIGKANATVVVTPYTCPSTVYNGLPHTATVTSITGVNGETGATVGTVNVSNTTHTNAGTYSSDTWTFTGTANYNNIGATTITDCIAKANAVVVVTPYTCPSTVYNGLPHTATVTSITGVNGETGATVGTVNVSNTTHTNAGTYSSDTWTFTGTANYNNIAATTITDCIAKANATVVVTPYTCPSTTYTGLPHTATVTSITGVNGETGATVGTVDVSNTTHTNAGTYSSDTWSFTGTTNYNNIAATTITDCIAKANATVVVTPYNVEYDGNSHTATVTSITGVNGETGATVGTVDVSGTTHVIANTYSDTWTFTGTANYNNIAATSITDVINKKDATWTTNPNSKIYGAADPVPLTTGSGSGFTAGDTALLTATYSRDPGETVLGGPYHITAALGPANVVANYNITNAGASFTIDPKAASVTPNAASKTYGAADPAFSGTLTGFLAADGVTATYSRTSGETVLGSPYTISATLSPAGVLTNYSITYNTASFTIDPKAASVTPNAASKTYGAVDPAFSGTLTGFLAADGVTATYSRTSGETVLGSPYTISATLSPAGVLSNYSITYNTASFTIDPKAASVTPNAASKTYGAVDPAFSGTLTGFLAADSVTATYSRTSGETVLGSPYTISATLSPAGVLTNYSITYNTASFTIDPKAASVTPNAASKTYGAVDPAFSGTLTGFLAADGVTATYSRTSGETVLGSPYTISATLSPAGVLSNYSITYNTASFTIDPKAASVTPNAASKTYGAADPAFSGTLTGFLAADGVTATYSRTSGETVLGSPYTISATLSPAGVLTNYSITYNTASFTIDPKAASVTPNAANKTYGAVDPAFSGTLTGFLAADSVTATYSRTSGETVLGSPYTISATLSPAGVLSNYSITYNTASFTIDPKAASVTPNAASKTYGAVDPAFSGTLTGFLAADGVTATYNRTSGETVLGSPYTISATLSPAGVLSNYSITYNTASFTIDPKAASVTPNAASKTYGAVDPAFSGTLTGFLAADGVTATYSRTSGETVLGSPYTISATLSPAGVLTNYSITYNTASFTIDPKAASVTPNAASKTYGAVDPAFSGTLTGFLAADGVTATYSRTSGETVLGSPYTISATLSPAGVLSNYSITYNTASFTIDPKAASVTPNAASKTYGAVDPAFSGTLTGFLAADGVTATYSRTSGETVLGSPYTISATLSPAGVLSNYSITYNTASFTIDPKAASVTPNAASKTYGAADPAFSGTLTGFLAADGVTATYSRTSGETVLGSPYTISATLSPAGVLTNYSITYNTADFTIDPKAASVTPNAASKTYGAADPAFSGTLTGFLAADGVTATYSRTSGETVLGSPYTISATLSPAGVLTNYSITYNTASFTIDPKAASVTPNAASKTYGAADPAFSGTLTGFLAADGVTATYSRTSGETVIDSPYTISATLSPAGVLSNYSITYNTAEFTIDKAHLTVTAQDKSRTYGAANPTFTATITGFVNGETIAVVSGSPTFSGTGPSSIATTMVGDYVITPAVGTLSATNYDFTPFINGTLHITKAHLTVTAQDKSRTYGAANPTFTAAITGFVNGETIAVVSGSPTFSGTGPSSTTTTTVGDYVITPAVGTLSATNYDFTPFVNGTLHITKAHLTVTAQDKSRTYGAANPTFTAAITGFVNGETIAVVSGSPTFSGTGPSSIATTTVGDYVITPAVGTLSATNYDFTPFVNGTLHITKASTTTTIISDNPDPSIVGQAYDVHWTVSPQISGTPTGTVTVSDGTASCSAAVSGFCTLTSTTAGPKTLTATYSGDANFLTGSDTESHNVNYTFIGFLPPIDNLPILNTSKAGQTIPVKWQLKDYNGNLIGDLNTLAPNGLGSQPIACDTHDPLDDIEELSAPGGTVFRFDGTQFIYNWQTSKPWANTCRLLVVTLADGTVHTAQFKFK